MPPSSSSSSSSPLPSPTTFLTSLFSSPLFTTTPTITSNPSSSSSFTSPASKPFLLTLHCLFPSEFLPALDLLDRHLVTRFRLSRACDLSVGGTGGEQPPTPRRSVYHDGQQRRQEEEEEKEGGEQQEQGGLDVVYYVRSSPRVRQRGPGAARHVGGVGTSYEVRTRAWNCTCPSFAFSSAFTKGYEQRRGDDERSEDVENGREGDGDWTADDDWLGGLALGSDVQVCKHLLACLLVERCMGLDGYVETRVVGRAEMAGWAAGWGG